MRSIDLMISRVKREDDTVTNTVRMQMPIRSNAVDTVIKILGKRCIETATPEELSKIMEE